MKTHLSFIVVYMVVALFLVSCYHDVQDKYDKMNQNAFLISKSNSQDGYSVSIDDLYKYIGRNREILSISQHQSEEGKTLCYLVNFKGGGFEIVSGDKRTYLSLAYSENGQIDATGSNENLESWLKNAEKLFNQLEQSDSLTDKMKYNIATWEYITGNKLLSDTKTSGQYCYLIDFTTQSWYSMNVGPLLNTNWGQSNHYNNDHYWNEYCPWEDSTMVGSKCPTGCVAVAGGQFAYYMKDIVNHNITIPISAQCTGYVQDDNEYYSQTFSSSLSTSMIYNMPLDYYETATNKIENARIFLAYIGNRVRMKYREGISTTYTSNLIDLFEEWDIETHYVNYADTTVRARILKQTPVIVRGDDNNKPVGHTWIIDGCKKQNTIRRNFYYISDHELTQEEINSLEISDANSYDEWTLPEVYTFHMNLGWNGDSNGWYLADDWSIGTISYTQNRKLIVSYKY